MNLSEQKKGIGLNFALANTHYTDHLAVICILMQIPLLVTDIGVLNLIKDLYPGLQILFEEASVVTPDYLASRYDMFFQSELCHRDAFYTKFHPLELKYKKIIRNIHCPHGFSDKGFYLAKSAFEDITLVYGDKMIDLLKENGVLEYTQGLVRTSNYRYQYYKKNQSYLDAAADKHVFQYFQKNRPVILYAPTWSDEENSSSFFEAADALLNNLPKEYNFLIKLHPHLEEDNIVEYYRILSRYEKRENVLFIKDFPLIYPILAKADLYIGDMSSIGYDFLAFNRPMFFLNHRNVDSFLFQCGVQIKPNMYSNMYGIIEKHITNDNFQFSKIRKKVYDHTFGKEIPFETIKQDIINSTACARNHVYPL